MDDDFLRHGFDNNFSVLYWKNIPDIFEYNMQWIEEVNQANIWAKLALYGYQDISIPIRPNT